MQPNPTTTKQQYLTDAEYYEGYWDDVYEQEYRNRRPSDLDYAVADVRPTPNPREEDE